MKIGILSDTHGDIEAWHLAMGLFEDVEHILHSGDILYHGAFNPIVKTYEPLDLADHINNSPVPIIFAKGNCDSDVDTLAIEYPIQSPYAFAYLNNKRILIHHGDKSNPEQMLELAKKYRLDLVIYGHTHIYELNKKDGVILLNPGSASLPKDPNKTKTAALMDEKEIKIFNLQTKEILTVQPLKF